VSTAREPDGTYIIKETHDCTPPTLLLEREYIIVLYYGNLFRRNYNIIYVSLELLAMNLTKHSSATHKLP